MQPKVGQLDFGDIRMAENYGGKRAGAGRKATDGVKPTVKFLVAMTESQRTKLKALGGAPFLRAAIDKAPDPKEPVSPLTQAIRAGALKTLQSIYPGPKPKVNKTPPRVSKSQKG